LLGTAVAGHSRSIAMRHECAICMAMASRIEATARPSARPQTRMAWSIDGAPQSNRKCAAADFDLCGSHAGFLLPDIHSGALSERRISNYRKDHRLRFSLRRNFFSVDAVGAYRANRRPDW